MKNTNSRGNVLFLILIAVALFAALSYVVTSSTRTGGSGVSKDKAKANAATIVQYGATLRGGVMRMKLSNGCTDNALDFSNDIFKNNNGTIITQPNANAPLNKTCHLFDPAGGGMIPVVPLPDALNFNNDGVAASMKTGHGGMRVFQVKNIGKDDYTDPAANDIIWVHNYLNRETCLAINDLLHVDNPSGEPPAMAYGAGQVNVDLTLTVNGVIDNVAINGQPAFCRYATASATSHTYQFMQVLVER